MSSGYSNPVCRGAMALGSGCGRCERCIASASVTQMRIEPTLDAPRVKPGRLLIVTFPHLLTDVQREKQRAELQSAADHAGARLLLVDGGATVEIA
ncbi:hypothetical protein [Pseudomonas chlororaphis]|nr:hypothetical protein [Pseudomonas chlororaphis]